MSQRKLVKVKTKKGRNRELIRYYQTFGEKNRLSQGTGQLEFVRTQEIIRRYLAPPPAVVCDVGGAAGAYSCWLAKQGYEVHLRDPVPSHVEQAIQASCGQADCPIASCRVGDARSLDFSDESADVMLFLGPMYHLPDRSERLRSLREAHRVLRKGGVIFVAAISRFASILDGFFRSFLDDPTFVAIVKQDLTDGHHRNPTCNPDYFTDAFFHHPQELRQETEEAGFCYEKILPVEGIAGLLPDFESHWRDEKHRDQTLEVLRWIEQEPSLLGASHHYLAIAKKMQEKSLPFRPAEARKKAKDK